MFETNLVELKEIVHHFCDPNMLDAEKDTSATRFRLQIQWGCKISNSRDFIPKVSKSLQLKMKEKHSGEKCEIFPEAGFLSNTSGAL